MRVVGKFNRSEFEPDLVEALRRGAEIDRKMKLMLPPRIREACGAAHMLFSSGWMMNDHWQWRGELPRRLAFIPMQCRSSWRNSFSPKVLFYVGKSQETEFVDFL